MADLLVPVGAALSHLGLDPETEDDTLRSQVCNLVAAATMVLEGACASKGFNQEDRTDEVSGSGRAHLYLPGYPITAVSAISMLPMTLATAKSVYDLCGASAPSVGAVSWSKAKLMRTDGLTWALSGLYTISYTAGYTEDNFPADLRMAVLMIVDHIWNTTGKQGLAIHISGRSEIRFSEADIEKLPVLSTVVRRYRNLLSGS